MSMQRLQGSCHCKAVRYQVDLDLAQGTHRCNCSLCWKARAWFAMAGHQDFQLLTSPDEMGEYAGSPRGQTESLRTYRFGRHCGVRIHAAGDEVKLGGKFCAVNIPTLDDASKDELTAGPLAFNDMLHDRPDRTPDDIRLL